MTSPHHLVTTADELRRAVEQLASLPVIGFDTETTSLDPFEGRLRLVQLAAPDAVYLIDLDRFRDTDPRHSDALAPLRDLLAAPRPVKVAHNAKFDAKWVRRTFGKDIGGIFDTLLASQLISAGADDRHSLEAVAARYLDEQLDKTEQLSDWGGELSESQLAYAARDAGIMLPLRETLVTRLKAEDLIKVAQLEFECVMPVAVLELNGIFLDEARWREQMAKVEETRKRLAEELQEMLSEGTSQGLLFAAARQDINLDSHTQLSAALKRLGVPVPDSTRNWKLQPLAHDYPVVAKLLEYRTFQKALTSYGANILEEISPVTHRIHANFHQIGAPTGRFSCTSPNVQQVPHEAGYRRCFRAPEGRKLVTADYSQVELRILADVTGDQGFIDAFTSGADLHRVTAAQVFNVKPEEVTSEQRSFSKRLNFGVVYGIGAQRFSAMTGLSLSEAEEIMRRYFATYRALNVWLREAAMKATRDREARTPLGRRARFFFDPADRQAASLAQRNGKNMPIQGASSDILKRALRLLHDELRGRDACLVNIVHDEIVVEAAAHEAEETAEVLKRAMCRAGEEYVKRVPVAVEAHVSEEWLKD